MRCSRQVMMMAGLLLISSPALAKKKKGSDESAPPPAVEIKPKTPGDPNSEAFAAKLITLEIANFLPLDAGSGVRFLYSSLRFAPDNTWSAQGAVEMMDERMECQETGTWEMEPATSAREATMVWNVVKTNCVNQTPGPRRYHVTIEGSGITVAYR